MMITVSFLFALLTLSNAFMGIENNAIDAVSSDAWQKPGCHKVGHTRKVSIPNCVEFVITTNACRGYCVSWAVPTYPNMSPAQPVTSVGQCCNIMESEPTEVRVLCMEGIRTLTFQSAINCACYHCKKD